MIAELFIALPVLAWPLIHTAFVICSWPGSLDSGVYLFSHVTNQQSLTSKSGYIYLYITYGYKNNSCLIRCKSWCNIQPTCALMTNVIFKKIPWKLKMELCCIGSWIRSSWCFYAKLKVEAFGKMKIWQFTFFKFSIQVNKVMYLKWECKLKLQPSMWNTSV